MRFQKKHQSTKINVSFTQNMALFRLIILFFLKKIFDEINIKTTNLIFIFNVFMRQLFSKCSAGINFLKVKQQIRSFKKQTYNIHYFAFPSVE